MGIVLLVFQMLAPATMGMHQPERWGLCGYLVGFVQSAAAVFLCLEAVWVDAIELYLCSVMVASQACCSGVGIVALPSWKCFQEHLIGVENSLKLLKIELLQSVLLLVSLS